MHLTMITNYPTITGVAPFSLAYIFSSSLFAITALKLDATACSSQAVEQKEGKRGKKGKKE